MSDFREDLKRLMGRFKREDMMELAIRQSSNFEVASSALEAICDQEDEPIGEDDELDPLVEAIFEGILTDLTSRLPDFDDEVKMYLVRRMTNVCLQYQIEAFDDCGFDNPFQNEDEDEDEPVRLWNWPIISATPSKNGRPSEFDLRERSALKAFGYTVGKTNGWPKRKRQDFLADFMELDLPHAIEREFGNEYGLPMTTNRLKKVADTISSNCSLAYRKNQNSLRYAINDWEDDLDFLHQRYYVGAKLQFQPWPDPKAGL